jgi:nucleoside-diphosphate-sugar epimerase
MKELSGNTVLVTGATGFIGQNLIERLKTIPDIHLILLSRKLIEQSTQNIVWVKSSLDKLTRSFWQSKDIDTIDYIFHLGAFTPKNHNEANDVESVYRDNLMGTRRLLESLPSSPKKFIFSSTLDVYQFSQEDTILDEYSPIRPSGLYGASKFFCEQLIQNMATEKNFNYAILRYGHIFGPGEEAYSKLIPQIIKNSLAGKPPVIYGDGTIERDFLFIDDVIEATLRAAIVNKSNIEPLNIVSGSSITVNDIVNKIIKITQINQKIHYVYQKRGGYSIKFNNQKMIEELGRWKFVSINDGLIKEIEYFMKLNK